jgi:hypothetical protein
MLSGRTATGRDGPITLFDHVLPPDSTAPTSPSPGLQSVSPASRFCNLNYLGAAQSGLPAVKLRRTERFGDLLSTPR